jgi:pimeloyl-ACP methyl ester carboxylesterase
MNAPVLSVRRWGAGEPVLFLHGLGASARYWDRLAEEATGIAGIAPDLLGFGRSPKPADSSYTVDEHLDALAPLLHDRSVVVGHSTGAILAAALTARERQRVAALLLVGLPAFPDEATARAQIGRLGLLARLTVEGHDLARVVCQAMCLLRPLAVTLGPLVIRDLPPTVVADGARHTWPSYSRTLQEVVVGHRPLPDVVAAAVPTVVAHGREDRVAPVALAEAWVTAARQRGAPVTLRLLEGDHHLAVRRPGAVAEVLTYLRSLSHREGEGGAAAG